MSKLNTDKLTVSLVMLEMMGSGSAMNGKESSITRSSSPSRFSLFVFSVGGYSLAVVKTGTTADPFLKDDATSLTNGVQSENTRSIYDYEGEMHVIGNVIHEINNASHEIDNAIHEINNASHEIDNAIHEIGNASHEIDNAIHEIDNASHEIGNAIHEIGNASHEIGDAPHEIGDAPYEIGNGVLKKQFESVKSHLKQSSREVANGICRVLSIMTLSCISDQYFMQFGDMIARGKICLCKEIIARRKK